MTSRAWKNSTGRTNERWPIVLLLLLLLGPSLGVMWFVRAAINSEQLASKQRLADAFRADLLAIQADLDAAWHRIGTTADDCFDPLNPAWTFRQILSAELCDGVICDDKASKRSYPALPSAKFVDDKRDSRWNEAEHLEYVVADFTAATTLYRELADQATGVQEQARAWQSLTRCLFKQQQPNEAVQVLDQLSREPYCRVEDAQGRQLFPNLELMAIEFLVAEPAKRSDETEVVLKRVLDQLTAQLNDYHESLLTSTQRLFLMQQIQLLAPESKRFETLQAEELSLRFLAAHPVPAKDLVLQPSQLADVWQLATPNGRCLLLFHSDAVRQRCEHALQTSRQHTTPLVSLLSPRDSSIENEFLGMDAGPRLPGWRLSVAQPDGRIRDAAAGRQSAIYLWTGALFIAATILLGFIIGRTMTTQIRLANLKNDLVGTVSHELKTPLAGMRLLVDTLLDTPQMDRVQTREYLQLIAQENTRLSRLIDNFLTFSRMERGRHAFDFRTLEIKPLIEQAIAAGGERFQAPSAQMTVALAADLPRISGDADGLVTVLLNLLDNAHKYSPPPRAISIHAYRKHDRVCLSVQDQGVGLSRSEAKRVFQRFYQVDQSLVREGHGCGLGLSIVKYIVDAHGGDVSVESCTGEGSTFVVELPADESGTVIKDE